MRFKKIIFFGLVFLLGFFCLKQVVFSGALGQDCLWENIEQGEKTLSRDEYRQLLERCKAFYEQKSEELEKDISKTEAEKKTLSDAIYSFQRKIQNLQYQINQSNVMIKDLGQQIGNTETSIEKTGWKIEEVKGRLRVLLRAKYEEDQKSTIEILLGEETLSGFFDNLVALEALNVKTQDLLANIKDLKTDLEDQKQTMDSEKKDLENLVTIKELQKQESAREKAQQEYFLQLTEKEYQKYVAEQKEATEKATKIGNLLFELIQVPEGGIKFEDAVEIAKSISSQTGVRAAFSLAVLWQETRIGKLKGGCYLRNVTTGDGVYIKTGNLAPKTMKPTRDVSPFLKIVKSLNDAGFLQTDAFHTPVSCCMITNGSYFGWGGAMGPAQFIASTWMLYKDEIEQKTGQIPANPWSVRDAFFANALYLRDLGASAQTYSAEIRAALRYFGCTSSWCQRNYGNPVMNVANCFQEYIDKGSMSVICQESIF